MIAIVLAAMILGFALDIPSERSSIDPKLPMWVAMLGDNNFRVREHAASELINSGTGAIPALRVGASSTDPEIAERCQKLIPAIRVTQIHRKTELLLKSSSEPAPKGLPGFERFIAITGDTREARELYVEMLRHHHEIVAAFDKGHAEADEMISNFIEQLFENAWKNMLFRKGGRWHPHTFDHRSEVVLLLFYLSDSRLQKDCYPPGFKPLMLTSHFVQRLVAGPESVPTIKKMFVTWYQNEKRIDFIWQTSKVAADAEMRELLPTMLRWLGDKNTDEQHKAALLQQIARLGDQKLIEQIEPLLSDKTMVYRVVVSNRDQNISQIEAQLGDIALRVCCRWVNQELTVLDTSEQIENDSNTLPFNFFESCGFENDSIRQVAHAKWRKLRAKMTMMAQKPTTQKLAG